MITPFEVIYNTPWVYCQWKRSDHMISP